MDDAVQLNLRNGNLIKECHEVLSITTTSLAFDLVVLESVRSLLAVYHIVFIIISLFNYVTSCQKKTHHECSVCTVSSD